MWQKIIIILLAIFIFSACVQEEIGMDFNSQSGEQGLQVAEKYAQARHSEHEIQGTVQGVFLAESFSKPLYGQMSGLQKGVMISNDFAVPELDDSNSVVILGQINEALKLDLTHEVAQAADRGLELEKHLISLRNLQKNANQDLRSIKFKITDANQNLAAANSQASNYQEQFTASLNTFSAPEVQNSVDNFKTEKTKEVISRAELGLLLALEERFEYYLPLLEQKITSLENNRKNIILGVRCR